MGRFRNNLCNSLKQPKDLEFMLKLFSFSLLPFPRSQKSRMVLVCSHKNKQTKNPKLVSAVNANMCLAETWKTVWSCVYCPVDHLFLLSSGNVK